MVDASDKKILFPVKVQQDNMLVVIPKSTKLSPELAKLSYEEFCGYTHSIGFKVKPKVSTHKNFTQLCASAAKPLEADFVLLQGRAFMPARDGIVKWLNNPAKQPVDLVTAGVAFAILYPARGPLPAQDVFGHDEELPASTGENKPLTPFKLHPELTVAANGEITSKTSGQVVLKPNFLDFLPTYTLTDVRTDALKNISFPCDVLVKCDLEGHVNWLVKGNLTVEGFWSASSIQVLKDAVALTGIQTNFIADEENSIAIKGNLQANFIQNSTLSVTGKVTVGTAVINSHLVIEEGDLECSGDPGKVIGSEVILHKGSVFAKSTGSEKNKVTLLHFHSAEGAEKSKVDSMLEGTRVQIKKAKMIIPMTQPWPPATPSSKK